MSTIKVLSYEDNTTKMGKPFKKAEVECEGEARKVNIFSNAPDYFNIKVGSIIDGVMTKEGNYWNIQYMGQTPRGGAPGAFKSQQIEKAMNDKRESIATFQDNKELSIKLASTIRMAVDVATSLTPDQWQSTTMQEEIRFWRAWFINEWSIDPKDTAPF